MFKVYEIKNKNRRGANAKRLEPIPPEVLPTKRPDERSVPYFSVVPEQFHKHEGVQSLCPQDRGMFLLLVTEVLWQSGGKIVNFSRQVAQLLRISAKEWDALKEKFINAGLLVEVNDGVELMQPELREQYIHFLGAH